MKIMDKTIICEQLTKQFGDFRAVDGISFHVNAGEIFGFLGANGAGKTTAMRMPVVYLFPVRAVLLLQDLMCISKPKTSSEKLDT